MGDLRAADRVRARGGDPAAAGLPARPPLPRTAAGATRRPPRSLAAQAPALLASFDLSGGRALALIRAAREVASGRVDLDDPDHERGWRRLRAIRGIGSWTIQMLASAGQGRLDQLPAGDLAYLKLVGRLRGGDPRARATEEEVERFFEPYAPYGGARRLRMRCGLDGAATGAGREPAAQATGCQGDGEAPERLWAPDGRLSRGRAQVHVALWRYTTKPPAFAIRRPPDRSEH